MRQIFIVNLTLMTLLIASCNENKVERLRQKREDVVDTANESLEELLKYGREKQEEAKSKDGIEVVSNNDIHTLASIGHVPLSYRELKDALRVIDSEGDDVRLLYTRKLRSKDQFGGLKGEWNREHVWPRSYGIEKSGADFTDLHAIFACDVSANSSRGNKFFDSKTDRDSWLPPVEMRGDIARSMFYMAVRYDGLDPETIDLKLSNSPDPKKGELGMLNTLLKWHSNDPVDARERSRNEKVKSIQGNSNPFVDDPALVSKFYHSNVGVMLE